MRDRDLVLSLYKDGVLVASRPVELGAELTLDDRLRVRVEPKEGADVVTLPAAPPVAGAFPAEAGDGTTLEVAQIWGDTVLRAERFPLLGRVRVGRSRDCAFFAHLPQERFPLIANEAGRCWLQLLPEFEGVIEEPGRVRALREIWAEGTDTFDGLYPFPVRRLPIEPGARIRVQIGTLTLVIRRLAPGARLPSDVLKRVDYRFMGVLLSVLFVCLTLGLGAWWLTVAGLLAAAPSLTNDPPAILAILTQTFVPTSPRTDDAPGAKAAGDAGTIGDPKASVKHARGGVAKGSSDREAMNGNPMVDALHDVDLNSMFGRDGLTGGLQKNLGAMTGGDLADQNGTHGLGLRGDQHGGGGHSLTIGFSDHGHGHGPPLSGPAPKKRDANVRVDSEEVQVTQMDPALIDAAIRRHLPEIEYCYDRELQGDAALAGKVVVHFVIAGDGRVAAAEIAQSTLGSAAVESCVVARMKAIPFPEPPGHGLVSVHYPFLFKSAGH